MEYTIVSLVARDVSDSDSQKTLRFSAYVQCPQSKQMCYAYTEKAIPVPSSVLRAHMLMQARIYSHVHGWKTLNLYETESLFTKLSVKHYLQSMADEKHQEMEITTSVS
jgi:hypothetical protein